ncbi:hypothetical protein H7F51_09760 [Novosphingobium flavum]|uniref:Uncharacterized protein n=1 Tax=Novosphingobium flavum TaxID=1778672 RepID=A0A7X1FRU6_9SPHN|nr:hypothetical protein [Novosphingobium flavum]MBC2665809.1 hypothetical protein [Novosphingobium flavum]
MSRHVTQADLAAKALVADAPVQTRVNRTFELPAGLYALTVACYLGFLVVMSALFMNAELVLPMAAFVVSIVGGFGLGWKWVAMKPGNDNPTLSMGQFASRGIQTLSGRLTAAEASAQVLILPVLILAWGLAIAVIYAVVGH